MMKRVALTGGTGFVGANLARRLLLDGHDVHLLVRPGHAEWRIAEIRRIARLHILDFLNPEEVSRTLKEIRPDWIFHLAAYGAYSSQTVLSRMVETNIIGTINLVNACLETGFEAFVNTGSSSEYGFKNIAPSETEFLEPNSHYAVSKASATLFCTYTARSQKVHIPTLRLYSVYGPYEEPSRLIPTLIRFGLEGKLPPLVNPNIARDYVYTDDVIQAFLLAAMHPSPDFGAVFNVGTGIQSSLREVVGIIRRILNIQAEPVWGSMPERIWDTNSWVCDRTKIESVLGWKPRVSFEDGLLQTIQWMRSSRNISNTRE
jgi:dolichol-phosphate mannosyltransferase